MPKSNQTPTQSQADALRELDLRHAPALLRTGPTGDLPLDAPLEECQWDEPWVLELVIAVVAETEEKD